VSVADRPAVTPTTVFYLFASEWAPPNESWPLYVPGATVDGPTTAGNLLNLALWCLRGRRSIDIESVRPYEVEKAGRVHKASFAEVTVLEREAQLPGLEGKLLETARTASDEDRGVRRLVQLLELAYQAPWTNVGGYCLGEANAVGIAELGGRAWHPIRKPVITDESALEALRPKYEEYSDARREFRQNREELDNAVLADCTHAVYWAHGEADAL
jgi:hypothetical protein